MINFEDDIYRVLVTVINYTHSHFVTAISKQKRCIGVVTATRMRKMKDMDPSLTLTVLKLGRYRELYFAVSPDGTYFMTRGIGGQSEPIQQRIDRSLRYDWATITEEKLNSGAHR